MCWIRRPILSRFFGVAKFVPEFCTQIILDKSLIYEAENEDDSLFLDEAIFDGPVPEDLASDHDRYLYGDD